MATDVVLRKINLDKAIFARNEHMTISRRSILKGALYTTTASVVGSVTGRAFAKATHRVVIKNFNFTPAELKIKRGDTVEWKNLDGFIHTATSDKEGVFDTDMIRTGWSASHTFASDDNNSEVTYHCELYPMMKGKIIIEA